MSSTEEDEPRVRYQAPVMENYASSILQLTETEETLYRLELNLRGLQIVEGSDPVRICDPLCNEQGINFVCGQVNSALTRVMTMSNIPTLSYAHSIVHAFNDRFIKVLMIKRAAFGIKDTAVCDHIQGMAELPVQMAALQALEEGNRRFLKGNVQEFRTTVQNDQKKEGFLSRMLPKSR